MEKNNITKNEPTTKSALSLSGVNEVITNINELAIIQTIYSLLVRFVRFAFFNFMMNHSLYFTHANYSNIS